MDGFDLIPDVSGWGGGADVFSEGPGTGMGSTWIPPSSEEVWSQALPALGAPTPTTQAPTTQAPTAPTAADTIPATGGPSGGWTIPGLQGLADIARQVVPVMQLGAGVLGGVSAVKAMQQAGQQQQLLQQAQRDVRQAAAPAAAAAAQLTPAGVQALTGGPLPPELEAQVEQWRNDTRAQLRQHAASAGITDSTTMAQWEGWIELQAQQLRASLAQGLLGGGLGATGAATGAERQVLASAMGQTDATGQALQAAQRALFDYLGRAG